MKIAVSSHGTGLDSKINPRFGRCDYLLVVDTKEGTVDAYPNENMNAGGGAGIQSAGFVISKGIKAVITGNLGPNAVDVFNASGIQMITGQSGTVGEAVQRFKNGELSDNFSSGAASSETPEEGKTNSMPSSPAIGQGRGMCGQGRGMGGGCGRGMGGGGRGMGRRWQ